MKHRIGLFALFVACAGLAFGSAFVETEKRARTASLGAAGVALRTGVDGSDSQAYTDTPGAGVQEILTTATDGTQDSLLKVIVRHSTNGQTARVEVGLWSKKAGAGYQLLDVADVQTSTATNRTYGALFLPERPLYFPLAGATHYEVRITDVSGAGTVDFAAHTMGAVAKAAE